MELVGVNQDLEDLIALKKFVQIVVLVDHVLMEFAMVKMDNHFLLILIHKFL
jgi:selenocysteine lyase/cysteine desulfurase